MSTMEDRPYQLALEDAIRKEMKKGKKHVILQLETGGGKTATAARIIKKMLANNKRVLAFAHQRSLVKQFYDKLTEWGIPSSILMSGFKADHSRQVLIVSAPTVWTRWNNATKDNPYTLPYADVLIVDECRFSAGDRYRSLLEEYEDCYWLGLDATPVRSDGRGLGDIWDALVCGPSSLELIEGNYLVPSIVYVPPGLDLRGVRWKKDGSTSDKQIMPRIMKPEIVGDVVSHWFRLGENRATVLFARNIEHSKALMHRFQRADVPIQHMDKSTPLKERQKAFDDLSCGRLKILVNVGVIEMGIDIPPASCCQLSSPDRSVTRLRQRIGRVRRPFEGNQFLPRKENCVVIDHSGACLYLGLPDDEIQWTLSTSESINKGNQDRMKKSPPIYCPNCFLLYSNKRVCPNCGWFHESKGRDEATKDGMLVAVDQLAFDPDMAADIALEKECSLWRRVLGQCANTGKSMKQARVIFYKKSGKWPDPKRHSHVPTDHKQWELKVAEVFPQFTRSK